MENRVMENRVQCPINFPPYRQLRLSYDAETQSLWYYMDPKLRPSFNLEILGNIRDFQSRVAEHLGAHPERYKIKYLVLASAVPDTFNLGGDLSLFARLIEARDRDGLMAYARLCIDAIYHNATNLGVPGLTTISLVQGTALGGGFEAALSSHVLIVERNVQMGFPEILFNLFPGMGAYSLLIRRLNPTQAEQLLHSGTQRSAEELHAMGVVDYVVENGSGVVAVRQFIRKHARAWNGHLAIQRVRQYMKPLSYSELLDIAGMWVEAAMHVTPRDLRTMTRLAEAQYRLVKSSGIGEASGRFELLVPSFDELAGEPARSTAMV